MSRYSNSYPSEGAAFGGDVDIRTEKAFAEAELARRSLGKEMAYHVEIAQDLHEQIGALHETLAPLLAPEQSLTAAENRMVDGPSNSEILDRADAHSRSLREAVERIRGLRSRIEL